MATNSSISPVVWGSLVRLPSSPHVFSLKANRACCVKMTTTKCNAYPSTEPSNAHDQALFLETPKHCEDNLHIRHEENLLTVKRMLFKQKNSLESMVIIDSLQRMGIDYHFHEEIGAILDSVYEDFASNDGDLFQVTLFFRLFRQSGYQVSPRVLNNFLDKNGKFKLSPNKDINGLLSLYEASHLSAGEDILHIAKEVSSKHLSDSIKFLEPNCARQVRQTLEHPCHMSIQRYTARQHISQRSSELHDALLDLAKSDFNMVQSLHQREFKSFLSWWKNLGLAQSLSFVRDQPLKWYMWPMTVIPEPQFSKCRIELTKVISFVYVIDDIFDVCGSVDELTLFTEAIDKWEYSAADSLPNHMRICYNALLSITNEITEMILKEHGWNPISSLKKSWGILCHAFLQEAKWFASEETPNKEEYLRIAAISTGVYTVTLHLFFLLGKGLTKENVDIIENNPNAALCAAMILRLWDDLGSAKDENQEGFDGSYVECYMKECPDGSTEEARDHVVQMISETWENLNKEVFSASTLPPDLVKAYLNAARMTRVMYSYTGSQNLPMLEDYISSLLLQRM